MAFLCLKPPSEEDQRVHARKEEIKSRTNPFLVVQEGQIRRTMLSSGRKKKHLKKTFDVMIITNTNPKVKIKRVDFMPPSVTENVNVNKTQQMFNTACNG